MLQVGAGLEPPPVPTGVAAWAPLKTAAAITPGVALPAELIPTTALAPLALVLSQGRQLKVMVQLPATLESCKVSSKGSCD